MELSKKLFIVFVLLTLASIGLLYTGQSSSNIGFDPNYFTVSNPDELQKLEFVSAKHQVVLEKNGSSWRVNNTYDADPSIQQLLWNMLQRMQVKRPVSKLSNEEIIKELKEKGTQVSITNERGEVLSFYAGGIASQALSYLHKDGDDRAYVVEIPGYTSYLSAIFGLSPMQWRSRVIFNTPWQSLKSLKVTYTAANQNDLTIAPSGYFPAVEGLPAAKLDSGKLITYLDKFGYFETNEYINRQDFPRYDSLTSTTPMAQITLEDLDIANNNTLKIFPLLKGDKVYLVVDKNDDMSVIEQNRLNSLLARPSDFILQ